MAFLPEGDTTQLEIVRNLLFSIPSALMIQPCYFHLEKAFNKYSAPHLLAHVSKFGLEIHVGTPEKSSESVVLFVSAPNRTYTNPRTYDGCNLDIVDLGNGVFIPIVERFVYLGSVLTTDCRDTTDTDLRLTCSNWSAVDRFVHNPSPVSVFV